TVAFDSCAVGAHDDAFDQALVNQNLSIKVADVVILPKKVLQTLLQSRSFLGDGNSYGVGDARIARVEQDLIKRQLDVLDLNLAAVERDFIHHQRLSSHSVAVRRHT